MKNLFLWLTLCVSIVYAQHTPVDSNLTVSLEPFQNTFENKLLAANDFKFLEGRMIVTEFPCHITTGNGVDKFVVSIVCLKNAFEEIGIEKINEIILFANKKAQATLNFEHNYVPTEIKISYNPAIKDWCLTNLFSTRDKNGTINTKLLAMDFDSTGKFIVMKRVF